MGEFVGVSRASDAVYNTGNLLTVIRSVDCQVTETV